MLAPHFTEDMYHLTTQTGKRLGEGAAAELAPEQSEQPMARQTVLASATLTETVLLKTAEWWVGGRGGLPPAASALLAGAVLHVAAVRWVGRRWGLPLLPLPR